MNKWIRITILFLLTTGVVRANDFVFTPINVSHGLSDNQVRYILQLHDNRMVFTTSGNLNIFDGMHFKYIHRTDAHNYPLKTYDGHYRVYQQGDSLLWIKDAHKIMCVDLYQEKYRSGLDTYFKTIGAPQQVEDLFIDAGQRLWILSGGKLWRSDAAKGLDISTNEGILQDLTTDDSNLYLFYNTGEVVCYHLKTGKKLYNKAAYPASQQALFKSTSLVVRGSKGFYQLRNGAKGGLFYFDTQKLTWEKKLETAYALNTLVIAQEDDEMAYVSCASGFWIIDCKTGTQQYLPELKTVGGNSIDTEISTLFYDNQGGFWLGTLNQGLLYYHPARYKLSNIGRSYFPGLSAKELTVQSFAEDASGNIYIRSSAGIYHYRPGTNNKQLTKIVASALPAGVPDKPEQKQLPVLQKNAFTALYTDTRGWTWAGTNDGLKLFIPGEPERIFYTEQGLPNNFIHAILEDRDNRVWVTTSYGISRILANRESKTVGFVNFNTFDGALNGEYTNGAIFQSSDGTLYFGGIDGFNVFKPNTMYPALPTLKPVFTGLFLKGDKVEIGKRYENRMILDKATPYTREIELSYNQNFLTLEFAAANYLNPSQTRYFYKLEGIDEHWHETVADGQQAETLGLLHASYTNLPPGKYIFKVKTPPEEQPWVDIPATLTITIHAPWWKTTTAYMLYLLGGIIIVAGAVWLYNRITRKRIERRHKEDILLLRIRNLIEQCKLLEQENETFLAKAVPQHPEQEQPGEADKISPADAAFLARAIELVEKNLEEPGYSVEALSRDLCMERTGLYRRLISVLDKSPSLFIRNIRLQNAARLILEEQLPIAVIAEKVGFSSASYLSRCFQETYGCRPSEYAEKYRQST